MNTTKGFTLIEVLIALLLLAVGLLGMAALQTATLRNNLSAYTYGQSTQLLYDMSDRMRANSRSIDATGNIIPSTTLGNYVIADTSSNSRTKGKTVSSTHDCRKVGNACTSDKLIDYDLIEWSNAIAATLPMGRGCIAQTNSSTFNLYITWDDDRSGTVTTDGTVVNGNNENLPPGCTFSTYVAYSAGTYHDPIFKMSLQL